MTEDTEKGPFPLTVLVAAVWSFYEGEQFTDPAEFNRRVSQYHVEATGEDTWDADEVVLSAPGIRVAYFGVASPEDDEYSELIAHLPSDDGARFTAGELLLKLNNAVAGHLKGMDHCYFEGLFLTDAPPEEGVPVYEMMQGS